MVEKEIQMAVSYLRATTESNYRIAQQTGISQPMIARYRRGDGIPGLLRAKALIAYFQGLEAGDEELQVGCDQGLPVETSELERLIEAIERRDAQMQELLNQQQRLITLLEQRFEKQ